MQVLSSLMQIWGVQARFRGGDNVSIPRNDDFENRNFENRNFTLKLNYAARMGSQSSRYLLFSKIFIFHGRIFIIQMIISVFQFK